MHRLVKLIVQPVIVQDDDDHLTEIPFDPFVVNAKDVPGLPDAMAASIKALDDCDE